MSGRDAERWKRADESVATRFTIAMNAATVRYGLVCDVVAMTMAVGPPALLLALSARLHLTVLTWALTVVAVAPLVACAVANVAVRNARRSVVDWIASQPFPLDNVNAVLAGLGEEFEVVFEGPAPSRDEVMKYLERVSEDVFVLEVREADQVVKGRLGVMDSKHNPHRQNYQRYMRLRQVVEQSLVPLHAEHAIALVRML